MQNCSKAVLRKDLRSPRLKFLNFLGLVRSQRSVEILIMKNYIEQRAVDLQAAIVVNKTQLPEPVHEKTDS